ncbi:MAG: hypothetical protein J1E02_09785, partial [Coprobacter sp.]|nr:hypothetical protein [Coprobacter sp.]
LLNEALHTLEATRTSYPFVQGVSNGLFSERVLTAGLSGIFDNLQLKKLFDKAEKQDIDELSPSEIQLLDAASIHAVIKMLHKADIPISYKIGEVTGEAIPDILYFAASYIPAKASTKTLLSWINRRVSGKTAQALTKSKITKLGLTATGQTLLRPKTYEDFTKRRVGETEADIGNDRKVFYIGQKGADPDGTAAEKAFLANFIENGTEVFGPALFRLVNSRTGALIKKAGKFLPESVGRALAKTSIDNLRLPSLIGRFDVKQFAKNILKNGLEESCEEFVASTINAFTVGDRSREEILSWENIYITVASSYILSAGMNGIAETGNAITRNNLHQQLEKAKEDIYQTHSRKEIQAAYELSGKSPEEQAAALGERVFQIMQIENPALKEAEMRKFEALQRYLLANDGYQAYLSGEQAQLQEQTDTDKNITPEQKSVHSRPNSHHYPSVQELSGGKDKESVSQQQVKKSEKEIIYIDEKN